MKKPKSPVAAVEKETQKFLDMTDDVILTNDYNKISQVVSSKEKYITY